MKVKTNKFENIIPACFAETLLMKTLGYSCEKNHQNGDGNVINTLRKISDRDSGFIGVMDKPKGISPSHIQANYIDIDTGPNKIFLKKEKRTKRYIIYIDEVLEDWIVQIGNSKRIAIPYSNFTSFKAKMKESGLLKDQRIINYFSQIKNENPEPFLQINKWVSQVERNRI